MGNYSMPRYFQNMPVVGKPVRANAENVAELRAVEDDIHAHIVDALSAGKAENLDYLVYRDALSREGRLFYLKARALKDSSVRRDAVAGLQDNYVARDELVAVERLLCCPSRITRHVAAVIV